MDTIANLTQQLQPLGLRESVARRQIARLIRQQEGGLALDDAILVGAGVGFLLGVFVWLARLKERSGAYAFNSAPKAAVAAEH